MKDEKPQKQIWTSPSLETLDMGATADGTNPAVETREESPQGAS